MVSRRLVCLPCLALVSPPPYHPSSPPPRVHPTHSPSRDTAQQRSNVSEREREREMVEAMHQRVLSSEQRRCDAHLFRLKLLVVCEPSIVDADLMPILAEAGDREGVLPLELRRDMRHVPTSQATCQTRPAHHKQRQIACERTVVGWLGIPKTTQKTQTSRRTASQDLSRLYMSTAP